MHPQRKQRLLLVLFIIMGSSIAVLLALYALRENIRLFYTPSQVKAGEAPVENKIRIGGLVVPNSIKRKSDSLLVSFQVTDNSATITINYEGILPDLFREGQGVIVKGTVGSQGIFQADEVVAKHDENYMPPEVHRALKNINSVNQ